MTNSQALAYAPSRFDAQTVLNSFWVTSLSIVAADLFALSGGRILDPP